MPIVTGLSSFYPRTITDAGEMNALLRAIGLRVAGDPRAIDPVRMFFGNRNAEVWVFDRQLVIIGCQRCGTETPSTNP
jgi:hypothetical protein